MCSTVGPTLWPGEDGRWRGYHWQAGNDLTSTSTCTHVQGVFGAPTLYDVGVPPTRLSALAVARLTCPTVHSVGERAMDACSTPARGCSCGLAGAAAPRQSHVPLSPLQTTYGTLGRFRSVVRHNGPLLRQHGHGNSAWA